MKKATLITAAAIVALVLWSNRDEEGRCAFAKGFNAFYGKRIQC